MVEYGAGAVALVDVDQVVGGFGELEEAVAELALLLGRGIFDHSDEMPDDLQIGRRRVAGHPHQLAIRAESLFRGGLEESIRGDDKRVRPLRDRFVSQHGLKVVTGTQDDGPVLRIGSVFDDLQFALDLTVRDQTEDAPLSRSELAEPGRIYLDRHKHRFFQRLVTRSRSAGYTTPSRRRSAI
ncbi:hypothetical protein WKI65_31765 [Streptomyces sp. MS1.AVA.3]|uniref:hypothetical protein n=1 Tax=Streptomyces decoyicus TaxID=249567 RepID=UPI0030BEECE0